MNIRQVLKNIRLKFNMVGSGRRKKMTKEEQERIINAVRKSMEESRRKRKQGT